MKFTLYYDGPLSSSQGDEYKQDKRRIWKAMHPQIREIWASRDGLKNEFDHWDDMTREQQIKASQIVPPRLMGAFERGNFLFVPLVTRRNHLLCELDILFLRAEKAGNLFQKKTPKSAGDLDNRLQVLFDGLRVPEPTELNATDLPASDQNPLYTLLEDDSMITGFRLDSDRLLDEPNTSNRVRLVIRVTVKTTKLSWQTSEFGTD
jgi:hypothetical protein